MWFYRRLAGLETDEAAPGYRHFVIRPQPAGGAKHAAYATRTPYGEASVSWEKADGLFTLKAVVPVGSTAHVILPATIPERVTEGGHPLASVAGVQVRGARKSGLALEVGSGSYVFVTPDLGVK